MDENISRAAGASHGQEIDDQDLLEIVEPLGRTLEQRTTLYGRTHTVGRRLRDREPVLIPVTSATPAAVR
jgi:FO synthase